MDAVDVYLSWKNGSKKICSGKLMIGTQAQLSGLLFLALENIHVAPICIVYPLDEQNSLLCLVLLVKGGRPCGLFPLEGNSLFCSQSVGHYSNVSTADF